MKLINRQDLENTTFLQTPKWLFDLLCKGMITPGGYTTYMVMYDRLRLSIRNNWFDDEGNAYIRYSYEEMMQDLSVKSRTQISRNLDILEKLNLIDKKRNYSSSSAFYLKIFSEEMPSSSTQNVCISSPQIVCDDSSTQSVYISSPQTVCISSTQIVDANNNNSSNNNLNQNQRAEDLTLDSDSLNFDFFKKLLKELSEGTFVFSKKTQEYLEREAKTMTQTQLADYCTENYRNIKANTKANDVNRVFMVHLKNGTRQVASPEPIKAKPEVVNTEVLEVLGLGEVQPKPEQQEITAEKYEALYQKWLLDNNAPSSPTARLGFDKMNASKYKIIGG